MRYLKCHPWRYTSLFRNFQHLFKYTPVEEILSKTMRYVHKTNLEGNYLEFGVYEGSSFVSAINFAELYKLKDMKFFAFDRFEGLPETKGRESKFFKKGDCFCDRFTFWENVCKKVKKYQADKCVIIQSWFEDLAKDKHFKNYGVEKAAVIMIDCDLYDPTVSVLKIIEPYLQDGTIIIFDDWFYGGEKKACEEWLKKNPKIKLIEFHKYDWNGMSFIVKLK